MGTTLDECLRQYSAVLAQVRVTNGSRDFDRAVVEMGASPDLLRRRLVDMRDLFSGPTDDPAERRRVMQEFLRNVKTTLMRLSQLDKSLQQICVEEELDDGGMVDDGGNVVDDDGGMVDDGGMFENGDGDE